MTTGRRTRSQVADEAMVVALSVGVCLDGELEGAEPCLKGSSKKGLCDPKKGFSPFSGDSHTPPDSEERMQKVSSE